MDRRVLITGASRGIGRATAQRLASTGFAVTAAYRESKDAAAGLRSEIHASGGDCELLELDVSNREGCRAALSADLEAHGAYWGVVCSAGVTADAPFPALKGEDWDRVLRTNLDGFFNVVQPLVMPMVRARKGGRIVVLSSVAGIMGNRGQVNYSASKAGLIGAARALAQELAKRNITVNAVAPGFIETDMIADLPQDELRKMIPMQRVGTPDDVAASIEFLFSEGAGYVTGQTLGVNGGLC